MQTIEMLDILEKLEAEAQSQKSTRYNDGFRMAINILRRYLLSLTDKTLLNSEPRYR